MQKSIRTRPLSRVRLSRSPRNAMSRPIGKKDPLDYGEGELLFTDLSDGAAVSGIAQKLASLSASIIADARGGVGVLSAGLTRFSGSGTVAGRAVTADCSEGSLLAVFPALEHAEPGDVLCMAAPARPPISAICSQPRLSIADS